jgi:hypothetical protein
MGHLLIPYDYQWLLHTTYHTCTICKGLRRKWDLQVKLQLVIVQKQKQKNINNILVRYFL